MTIAELIAKLTIKPDKRSFDAAEKLLGGLKAMLLGLVAVKTGQFFAGMVQDTAELGGHIDDLAQSSGSTTTELQEMGYAAVENGSSLDEVAGSMVKLSKNMYEAANGNKELAKSFRRAGVPIKNADGTLRSSADVMQDLADHLAEMPDGAEKTALAMEYFGKTGASLIPLLNNGGDGIQRLREEAHELGGVMSEEGVKALADFGDEQDKLKFAVQGFKNEAVIALMPTIKEMVTNLIAWIKANREILKQKLITVIKGIATAAKFLAKGVGIVIDVMEFLGKHIRVVEVVLVSLIAAIGIFKAASIAAAITSGLAWAAANIPLILLAVFIAGLILLVEDVVTAFAGGKSVIAEFFNKKVGSDFVETMTRVAGATKAAFVAVFDYLRGEIEALMEKGRALGDFLYEMVNGSPEGNVARDKFLKEQFGFETPDSMTGIDAVAPAPDPVTQMPAPSSVTNGGNTFQAKIEINGANASADGIANSVTQALESFWGGQMRKAASQSGSAR